MLVLMELPRQNYLTSFFDEGANATLGKRKRSITALEMGLMLPPNVESVKAEKLNPVPSLQTLALRALPSEQIEASRGTYVGNAIQNAQTYAYPGRPAPIVDTNPNLPFPFDFPLIPLGFHWAPTNAYYPRDRVLPQGHPLYNTMHTGSPWVPGSTQGNNLHIADGTMSVTPVIQQQLQQAFPGAWDDLVALYEADMAAQANQP